MKIEFTKMHGIGNDYVYINCLKYSIDKPEELAIKLSNRNFGIGADGLILIMPSEIADFRMRMFNADGSEAQMCGNGVRCVAKYLYDKGLTDKQTISLETNAGIKILTCHVNNNTVDSVTVDMGTPELNSSKIPVVAKHDQVVNLRLMPELVDLPATCVSMGNPHVIFFVDEISDKQIHELGPKIETYSLFPEKTNVEFVKVISRSVLEMRVWERGSGETFACGTGACAVAVAGVLNGFSDRNVKVKLLGGELEINWAENNHVFMKGPATISFEGTIDL